MHEVGEVLLLRDEGQYDSRMTTTRVAARVRWGVIAYLGYLAVFYGVWIANGIDYNRIGENEDTLLKWYVMPLAAGAVVIIIFVSAYGWWKPSLFDTGKRLPKWVWIIPALMALVAAINLLLGDYSSTTPTMWLYLVVGSILVGFNEELVTRGQLIVALRSRYGELGVWFVSTLLFALLHLPNTLFGTGPFGVIQVLFTFLVGSTLYLVRRVSGTLIFAMVLHGFWDFSTFASNSGLGSLGPVIGIAAVIVAIRLTRRESRAAIPIR